MSSPLFKIILGMIAVYPVPSYALSCKFPTIQEAFKDSEVVFAGKVKYANPYEEVMHVNNGIPGPSTRKGWRVRLGFEISKIWKGNNNFSGKVLFFPYGDGKRFLLRAEITSCFSENCKKEEGVLHSCDSYADIGQGNGFIVFQLLDRLTQTPITYIDKDAELHTRIQRY